MQLKQTVGIIPQRIVTVIITVDFPEWNTFDDNYNIPDNNEMAEEWAQQKEKDIPRKVETTKITSAKGRITYITLHQWRTKQQAHKEWRTKQQAHKGVQEVNKD